MTCRNYKLLVPAVSVRHNLSNFTMTFSLSRSPHAEIWATFLCSWGYVAVPPVGIFKIARTFHDMCDSSCLHHGALTSFQHLNKAEEKPLRHCLTHRAAEKLISPQAFCGLFFQMNTRHVAPLRSEFLGSQFERWWIFAICMPPPAHASTSYYQAKEKSPVFSPQTCFHCRHNTWGRKSPVGAYVEKYSIWVHFSCLLCLINATLGREVWGR